MKKLEEYVRSIPDFPQKGVIFRDVTSVLEDAQGLRLAIDTMQGTGKGSGIRRSGRRGVQGVYFRGTHRI